MIGVNLHENESLTTPPSGVRTWTPPTRIVGMSPRRTLRDKAGDAALMIVAAVVLAALSIGAWHGQQAYAYLVQVERAREAQRAPKAKPATPAPAPTTEAPK